MQTVYIDVLIFVNLAADFVILYCTKKILHINVKHSRVILGSIVCALLSPVALLYDDGFFLNLLYGILSACLGVFVTFGRCSIENYIKRAVCFFCVNFLFSGIMIGIYLLFEPKGMVIINNVVYFQISPVLLIILTFVCYIILTLFDRLIISRKAGAEICRIKVNLEEHNFEFDGLVDTGCSLAEPFSGSPVIVAEKNLFNDFVPPCEKLRVIPFSSMGGEGIIKGIKARQVYINGRLITGEIYIGFCENTLSGEVKALIPKNLGVDLQ